MTNYKYDTFECHCEKGFIGEYCEVDCQLYSIGFVSFQLFQGGHLHTIVTNVDIAPELVERLHPTTR